MEPCGTPDVNQFNHPSIKSWTSRGTWLFISWNALGVDATAIIYLWYLSKTRWFRLGGDSPWRISSSLGNTLNLGLNSPCPLSPYRRDPAKNDALKFKVVARLPPGDPRHCFLLLLHCFPEIYFREVFKILHEITNWELRGGKRTDRIIVGFLHTK